MNPKCPVDTVHLRDCGFPRHPSISKAVRRLHRANATWYTVLTETVFLRVNMQLARSRNS